MSDCNDCSPRSPDREDLLSAVELSYKTALNDLASAGDRLSSVADLVDLLDDDELVSLPFLLSRQLEVIRLAIRWVTHTVENLPALEGGEHDDTN